MKVENINVELLLKLEEAWVSCAPTREDAARPIEALSYLLVEDGGTQWYQINGHDAWFYIRQIVPSLSAEFYCLSLEETLMDRKEVKSALRDAMREYDLRRFTLTIPAPVNPKFFQSLGFVQEGRLKDATIYNGKYEDLLVFGFNRAEVEHGLALTKAAKVERKTRKRKRRSRRNKKAVSQEKKA